MGEARQYDLYIDAPDDVTDPEKVRVWAGELAAQLAASVHVDVCVSTGDPAGTDAGGSAPTLDGMPCDARYTLLNVAFRVCTGRNPQPVPAADLVEIAAKLRTNPPRQ